MKKLFPLFMAFGILSGISGNAQTYCTDFEYTDPLDCSDLDGPVYFELNGEEGTQILYDNEECNLTAYFDYTASTNVSLAVNNTYNFDIEAGYEDNIVSIWIDFNDNGTFEATEKLVAEALIDDYTLTSIALTIPAGSVIGSHRMRVFGAYNFLDTDGLYPCNADDDGLQAAYYGKVLDFTVEIVTDPLPVTFISFEGHAIDAGTAELIWKTQDEKNNKGFEILKSTDGSNFSTIAFVPNNINESGSVKQYAYIDKDFNQLSYYKLLQIDIDGKKTIHSQVVKIDQLHADNRVIVTPNPARNYIQISTGEHKVTMIHIYDATGKLIKQIATESNNQMIDITELNAGNYLIQFVGTDNPPNAIQFVKL